MGKAQIGSLQRFCRLALAVTGLVGLASPVAGQMTAGSTAELVDAIDLANGSGTPTTITFTQSFTLSADIPIVTSDITFVAGAGCTTCTLDGNGRQIFFIDSGTVVIQDLTLANGRSQGGNGGFNRGGGGLGAGGALFVNETANVTLRDVVFTGNVARGGDGGIDRGGVGFLGGGGGGFHGNGGSFGGGGGGFRGNGANDGGGGGGFQGNAIDSNEDKPDDQKGDGGGQFTDGGGGGGNQAMGGMGQNGAEFQGGGFGSTGGNGGRFGGGGGSSARNGGDGGDFGGGGGSAGAGMDFSMGGGLGGSGGFGGGGGGGSTTGVSSNGGFGGGAGTASGQGGAGSSLGGAVFVRTGGQLTWELTSSCPATGCTSGNSLEAASGSGRPAIEGEDLYAMTETTARMLVDGVTATLNGTIGGAGALRKEGTGTLVFADVVNTYSGGTQIADGTLRGTTRSIQGDITTEAGSAFVDFLQDTSGTYSGVISGSGGVSKSGAGEVRFTGRNTYAGRTSVFGGVLTVAAGSDANPADATLSAASSSINVFAGGTLRFDQNLNGTFSGTILNSTAGTLEKTGNATLTLDGDYDVGTAVVSSGALAIPAGRTLTATTQVNAGELALAGSLDGPLTVASGARLSGSGAASGGPATVNGLLAPGGSGSIGTLTFMNGLTLGPSATFEVDLQDVPEASDFVMVTGGATSLAGTLAVVLSPGYAGDHSYTLLTSANPAAANLGASLTTSASCLFTFDTVTSSDVSNLVLDVTQSPRLDVAPCANTSNQQAVGRALQLLVADAGVASAVGALSGSPATTSTGLDLLSGEGHAGFRSARLAAASQFLGTLSGRMRDPGFHLDAGPAYPLSLGGPLMPSLTTNAALGGGLRESLPGAFGPWRPWAAAAASRPPSPFSFVSLRGASGLGGWLDGFASFASVDGDRNTADTDFNLYGTTGGVDWTFLDGGLVGAAFGYTRSKLAVADRATWGTGDTFQGALYGSWATERFYVGAVGRYALTQMDIRRQVDFSSLLSTADGDYDGTSISGYLEAGWAALDLRGTMIQPLASFAYTYLDTEEFTETGAPGVNLNVDSEQVNSLVSNVGFRVYRAFAMDRNADIVPELRARWGHEFGDIDRPISASFADAAVSVPFEVDAAEIGRDVGIVGVGWTVLGEGAASLSLNYDATINEELVAHTLTLGLLISW